jgi:hypothetical protein
MAAKTIWIKGDGIVKEAAAGGAITPGHLIHWTTTGTLVVHPNAAKNAIPMFALEKDVVGKGITTAYASGEMVQALVPSRGAEIYALLPASAAAVVIGDYLESVGDGTLKKVATDTATDDTQRISVVARALEAVDNSGGGSPARIRVEVV